MPRKGENIYKRKDGRWEGRIWQENTMPGRRKYISVYGKTYKEVKGKMEKTRNGHIQSSKGLPDMEEAASIWLEDRKQFWKPTTYAAYQQIVDKYIGSYLGKIKINKIDSQVMADFHALLRSERENMLSANYLSYICAVVIRVLAYAKKKYGIQMSIPENPVVKSKKGQIILPGEHAMSVLEEYLLADSGKNINLGILVAFYTGIRIGELCALKWEDIDLNDGIIYIKRNIQRVQNPEKEEVRTSIIIQAPKTVDSIRIVPIPPVLLPLLEQHRKEDGGHVIQGAKNPWADPRTVQYQFKKILERCGLEHFNFHMLRHAFATRCIAKGFDVKSLSEILGHSDIRLTLNLYVHSTVQQKKQLMNRFDTHLYQEQP